MRAPALVALTLVCAAPSAAQVAIAPLVEAQDAVHRDIVGAVATELGQQWEMLTPQLTVEDVKACKDSVECVLAVAKKRGATHVVLVSVAPLGARDEAVAVQLYAVGSGARVRDESAVLSTRRDVRQGAAEIGKRVAGVDGPPKKKPPPPDLAATGSSAGVMSFVGVGLLGAAAATGVAGIIIGSASLGGATADDQAVTTTILVASIGTGVLAVGGVALLAVDAL